MMMSKVLLALSSVLVLAGCSPDVPANPTYTKDVASILDAHCVRCHGADDMLHMMQVPNGNVAPMYCYLQQYADVGPCTSTTDCKFGAGGKLCPGMIQSYITLPADSLMRMPPPPSEPLNDWEKDVILRWVHNGAPQ